MNDRYQRGLEMLNEIDRDAGRRVIESLQHICPDLARYVIKFPFGDAYARAGLSLKNREIATGAARTALNSVRDAEAVFEARGLLTDMTTSQAAESVAAGVRCCEGISNHNVK
jgi:4-carboxymuconolactone decarboxylase